MFLTPSGTRSGALRTPPGHVAIRIEGANRKRGPGIGEKRATRGMECLRSHAIRIFIEGQNHMFHFEPMNLTFVGGTYGITLPEASTGGQSHDQKYQGRIRLLDAHCDVMLRWFEANVNAIHVGAESRNSI